MIRNDLFSLLVRYHIEHNLPPSLPHVTRRSKLRLPNGGLSVEGATENPYQQGLLIIADGETLADRLQKTRVILGGVPEFQKIADWESFRNYLESQDGVDGAYLMDTVNGRIAHVVELNNNPDNTEPLELSDLLPDNFLSCDGNVPVSNVGTKTRLALRLPRAYSTGQERVEALQIKRTAYLSLGIGKVTRITPEGLAEEFFFEHDPNPKSEGPFINKKYGIVGIHRTYERTPEGELRVATETRVDPQDFGIEPTPRRGWGVALGCAMKYVVSSVLVYMSGSTAQTAISNVMSLLK
ncbi:hypothetical protein J4457_00175 [Candidatus Woesearchaeota archaeon]|nr:hypothetical protein [Candidatus Woesearchaeota archaeon]